MQEILNHHKSIMEIRGFAIIVTCLVAAESALPAGHYCRDVLSEELTRGENNRTEMCQKVESCLKMYTIGSCQNGLYFKRSMSEDEVLDQYCTSLANFDEALQESWDFLQEIECVKRNNNNVDVMRNNSQLFVTTGLWDASRRILRSIDAIVCSRIKHELECRETISPYAKHFVRCFMFMYYDLQPGFFQMLVAGPEKTFDRQKFCTSVSGMEACVDDAVTDACDTTMSTKYTIMGELFVNAKLVWDMAECHAVP